MKDTLHGNPEILFIYFTSMQQRLGRVINLFPRTPYLTAEGYGHLVLRYLALRDYHSGRLSLKL